MTGASAENALILLEEVRGQFNSHGVNGLASRTEASLLREALDDLFEKYRNDL